MLFNGLIFLICIAPIHLGANRPISWSIVSLLSGLLLLGWTYKVSVMGQSIMVSGRKIAPLITSYILVCLWIVVQCLDIGLAHPLWSMTEGTFGTSTFSTISVAPYKTLTGLMRLLAYGSVFWLSLQYCRRANNTKKLFNWIIIASSVYALYGLYIDIAGIPKWNYPDSVTSTFINRNSYATYAGISAIIAFAMLIKTSLGGTINLSRKQKTLAVITNSLTHGYKYLIPFLIFLSAIILTHSRAGLASFILGITVLIITFLRKKKWVYPFIAMFVIIVSGLFFAGGETIERFSDIQKSAGDRAGIYKVTINTISDMPYLGSGYNTFEEIFKLYKDSTISYEVLQRIDHAHNTYLENMLELGIPVFTVLMFCFVNIFWICGRGIFVRKRNMIYPATGVAVTVLVGFHSLFDFSLEMPAVAVLYAGVMGGCCAQSWSTREMA